MQIGWTPINVAAYQGHRECVQALIELGADVNRASGVSVVRHRQISVHMAACVVC